MSITSDDTDAGGRGYDAGLLRRLLGYLRPHRGLTAVAITLLLSQSALALGGPRLTAHALDVAAPPQDLGLLGRLAGLYLTTRLRGVIVEYGGTPLMTDIGQPERYQLRR